jgi:hypothetical protein
MVIVLFSRALMVPVYSAQLKLINPLSEGLVKILKATSFGIMIFALFFGAVIILVSLFKGLRSERKTAIKEALDHGEVL